MNLTIEITVSPKGEITVETKGFAGAACKEASRFVEQALGRAHGETLTPAFYLVRQADQPLRESH